MDEPDHARVRICYFLLSADMEHKRYIVSSAALWANQRLFRISSAIDDELLFIPNHQAERIGRVTLL